VRNETAKEDVLKLNRVGHHALSMDKYVLDHSTGISLQDSQGLILSSTRPPPRPLLHALSANTQAYIIMFFLTFVSTISCYVMWNFTLVSASSMNITIDDQYGDPVTGQKFSYSNEWAFGPECSTCTAKPDASQAWNGTWHDSSFLHASESSPTNATVSFNGTAFYVYCIIYQTSIDPDAQSNMRFMLDGEDAGTFILPESTSSSANYLYHHLVFSKDELAAEEHTFTLVNGQQGSKTDAMTLLDYLVYTTDVSDSDPQTPLEPTTSSASATSVPISETSIASSQTTSGTTDDAKTSDGMSNHTRIIVIIASTVGGTFILVAVIFCWRRRIHGSQKILEEPTFEELESLQTTESYRSVDGMLRNHLRRELATTEWSSALFPPPSSVTGYEALGSYTASPTGRIISPRREGSRNEMESVTKTSVSTYERFPRSINPESVTDLRGTPMRPAPEPFPYNPSGPLSPNRGFYSQDCPLEMHPVRALQDGSLALRLPEEATPSPGLIDAEASQLMGVTLSSVGTVPAIPRDHTVPDPETADTLGGDAMPSRIPTTACSIEDSENKEKKSSKSRPVVTRASDSEVRPPSYYSGSDYA